MMESHESSPPLSEALRTSLQQAVRKALEAAIPGIATATEEHLQAEIKQHQQQQQPQAKATGTRAESSQPSLSDILTSLRPKFSLKEDKNPASSNAAGSDRRARDVIAWVSNMNESTAAKEIDDWRQAVKDWESALEDDAIPQFKIGSRGSVDYAISLSGDHYPLDFDDHGFGHRFRDENTVSEEALCLCRIDENEECSHSIACPENTTETSFDDDLGRFIRIGNLVSRQPGEFWGITPLSVVKSLKEGGLWIIGSVIYGPNDDDFNAPDEDMGTTPLCRARLLRGVGNISVARLPNFVFLTFSEVKGLTRQERGVRGKEKGTVAGVEGNREIEFQRQYSGGFVLPRPKSW